MSRTAVLFRTHVWDRHVADAAEQMRARSDGADFFILADETRGTVPAPADLKLAHSAYQFDAMGLEPQGHSLWYNGDYPLYAALERLPDHDSFVMAEFDVRSTISLGDLGAAAAAQEIDLIAHRIGPAPPGWAHARTCEGIYETVYNALIPLIVVSRRFVGHMLARRREMTGRLRSGDIACWPYCEAFVPSEAVTGGFRTAELSEFGDTTRFDWTPPRPEAVMRDVAGAAFLHPVLDDARYIASQLRYHEPSAFLDPSSPLSADLDMCDPVVAGAGLLPACKRKRDYMTISRLRHRLGLRVPSAAERGIAFGKPATQSSISPFSVGATLEQDAGGANDGVPSGDYSFHTATEEDPWWMVDLLSPFTLKRVRVANRSIQRTRARRFTLLASLDGNEWAIVLRKADDRDFGGADGTPFEAEIEPSAPARFVKLRLDGHTCLHLDQIELFGSPAGAPRS